MKNISAILLAAGTGSRLMPLTKSWPKCLMPIQKIPLLEFWLSDLWENDIKQAIVNTCHHGDIVSEFLSRPRFRDWVQNSREDVLLGTAGTIRKNIKMLAGQTILMAHADNWSGFNLTKLLDHHKYHKESGCLITMLLFNTDTPKSCGIVELDKKNKVIAMHEKKDEPRGNLANGAIYVLEPDVIDWISQHETAKDFSLDVLPNFMGKIYGLLNSSFHRDIGTISNLILAQKDPKKKTCWERPDKWQKSFERNPIHKQINCS